MMPHEIFRREDAEKGGARRDATGLRKTQRHKDESTREDEQRPERERERDEGGR